MSTEVNSPQNPHNLPNELLAYQSEAQQAEDDALNAIGNEIVRSAEDYESSIDAMGEDAVREAERVHRQWGVEGPAALGWETSAYLHQEAVESPKKALAAAEAAKAYTVEVTNSGEALKSGEGSQFEDNGLAADAEEFLVDPEEGETVIRNMKQLDPDNTGWLSDFLDRIPSEADVQDPDTGQGNGGVLTFDGARASNDGEDRVTGSSQAQRSINSWHLNGPPLSQLAETNRQRSVPKNSN